MSESIRVDVARECDLAEISVFLVGRGFTTEQVQTDSGVALDVTDRLSGRAHLDADVWDALTSWLAGTDRQLVPRVLRR